MSRCIVAGCQNEATEEPAAFTEILGERVAVHLCEDHLEWLRRGTLRGLSIGRQETTPE